MKIGVRPWPHRNARAPPRAATASRARLPSTGQESLPAPCEAKYNTNPTPKNPYSGICQHQREKLGQLQTAQDPHQIVNLTPCVSPARFKVLLQTQTRI